MTGYPSADDYLKAIQNPKENFTSGELKSAQFPVHPRFGIPMPASGTSAVVFKAVVGGEEQALRFFTRHDVSSWERYNALNQHFKARAIADCMATSRWFDDAIIVNGKKWPLVRMQWVDGRNLDRYIAGLIEDGNTTGISALAKAWRNLLDRMQIAEFAHGDLQHGNVLVDAKSALRLVDFDCSWIPPFAGQRPPSESGHRNYQRSDRPWGQWMDTFPGLVIYTSLVALSKNAKLWEAFNDGENLIFRLEDFDPPHKTDVWRRLANIGDGELDAVTARLKEYCALGVLPHGALKPLLQRRWWEQTRPGQAPAATARAHKWPGEPSASNPGAPERPGVSAPPSQPAPPEAPEQPLPPPRKIDEEQASRSIPKNRPPSGTPPWPHKPGARGGSGPPRQGPWWGQQPAPPPSKAPPPRSPNSPPAGPSPVPPPPVEPNTPRRWRQNWASAVGLIILALIFILVIAMAVSFVTKSSLSQTPTPPPNPTSPYTAMQVFGAASNNGDCSTQYLYKYRLTNYDNEVVVCTSGIYNRFFFKYSGTNPDTWVNAARQDFSSLEREQTGSCYDTYSATFSTTDGLFNVALHVYRTAPFVAEIVANARYANSTTVQTVPHYYINDFGSGSPLC